MSPSNTAIRDYIVRELAPAEQQTDEAPLTVDSDLIGMPDVLRARGRMSMRPTPEEARARARTLRDGVRGLCQSQASGDAVA